MRVVYNDIPFDSQLECNNYRLLENSKVDFEYNSERCEFAYHRPLQKGECRTCGGDDVSSLHNYTCDFVFKTLNTGKYIHVETKGNGYCFKPETRTKHILLKKQYPEVDMRFVFSNWNAKISRGAKTSNREWAERYGFPCANKYIPTEWLNE
jgi:hypothetical protein